MADDVLYFNGRFTTTAERVIGVEDRGFQFGDGVYEVLKFLRKVPLFTAEHYGRLCAGLRELEIRNPFPDAESFGGVVDGLLKRTPFPEGLVYIQITRGESERAHFYPENIDPTVAIYSRRFTFPDAAKKQRGIAAITAPDTRWSHCNVKSLNLLGNVLAKKRAQRAGAEESLFLDGGLVTEGASSTFFAVRDGRLITHPADRGILPGTVRDHVISIALREKIRVDERPVHENELFSLDEAFLTSTSQGVMPITTIDGRSIGEGVRGEVTGRLQSAFDQLERLTVGEF
jgi:D-alanine transaminase